MEPETKEIENQEDLNANIATLLRDLPKPIRDFIQGPERNKLALALTQKYTLHADQAGTFERGFIFLLLGIYTPDEFVKDLKDAGVPPESVNGLAADINTQVFIPLRDAERKMSKEKEEAQVTPTPTPAAAPSPVPTPKREEATLPSPISSAPLPAIQGPQAQPLYPSPTQIIHVYAPLPTENTPAPVPHIAVFQPIAAPATSVAMGLQPGAAPLPRSEPPLSLSPLQSQSTYHEVPQPGKLMRTMADDMQAAHRGEPVRPLAFMASASNNDARSSTPKQPRPSFPQVPATRSSPAHTILVAKTPATDPYREPFDS